MFVSILMVRALIHVCEQRGINRSVLLQGFALPHGLLELRARVHVEDFDRLAERAVELTEDEALGLAIGSGLPPAALQIVGLLLNASPTLRQAFADLERYSSLLAVVPNWSLVDNQSSLARAEFSCPTPRASTQRMANDWAIAMAHRSIARFDTSSTLAPTCVEFTHARPSDVRPYRDVFPCDVHFGRQTNAVTFPAALLDRPHLHGDPFTCRVLRETADHLVALHQSATRLSDRARAILRRSVDIGNVDVASLAQQLALSETTLRRGLAAEQSNPLTLIDEARRERAYVSLAQTKCTIKELAHSLGYADPRSFARAFKRWTGRTPVAVREAQRQLPPRGPS